MDRWEIVHYWVYHIKRLITYVLREHGVPLRWLIVSLQCPNDIQVVYFSRQTRSSTWNPDMNVSHDFLCGVSIQCCLAILAHMCDGHKLVISS